MHPTLDTNPPYNNVALVCSGCRAHPPLSLWRVFGLSLVRMLQQHVERWACREETSWRKRTLKGEQMGTDASVHEDQHAGRTTLCLENKTIPKQKPRTAFLSLVLILVAALLPTTSHAEATQYTVLRDTPIRKEPFGLSDVLTRLPRVGTPVTWLRADAQRPRWQRVRARTPEGSFEGFVAEDNLDPIDPTLVTPVRANDGGGLLPSYTTVTATAAARAFLGASPSTQEYVRRIDRRDILLAMQRVAQLQQAITRDQVDAFHQRQGLRTFDRMGDHTPATTNRPAPLPLSSTVLHAAQNVLTRSGGDPALYPAFAQPFVNQPVQQQEAEQLSELTTVALAKRYGGLMVDKPEGINDMLIYLYNILAGLMGPDLFQPGRCRVYILNTSIINAFSTPSCNLFVTRGLLQATYRRHGNGSHIAEVVGHEFQHAYAGDGLAPWQATKAQVFTRVFAPDAPPALKALQPAFSATLKASCNGALNLDHLPPQVNELLIESYINLLTCASYDQEQEFLADRGGLRRAIQAGYRPDYTNWFALLQNTTGFSNHPRNELRVSRLNDFVQSLRPTPTSFGYQDWPFATYTLAPLDTKLFQVFDEYDPPALVATAQSTPMCQHLSSLGF